MGPSLRVLPFFLARCLGPRLLPVAMLFLALVSLVLLALTCLSWALPSLVVLLVSSLVPVALACWVSRFGLLALLVLFLPCWVSGLWPLPLAVLSSLSVALACWVSCFGSLSFSLSWSLAWSPLGCFPAGVSELLLAPVGFLVLPSLRVLGSPMRVSPSFWARHISVPAL